MSSIRSTATSAALVAAVVMFGGSACNCRKQSRPGSGGAAMLDLSGMAGLGPMGSPDDREFILRYLASHSHWRVTRQGGIVAEKRRGGSTDVRVRFGPYGRTPVGLARAVRDGKVGVVHLQDLPPAAQVPLWDASDASGCICSYLIAEGPGIQIEIKEQSIDPEREATRQALGSVLGEIRRIAQLPRGKDDAEYWQDVLPAGSLAGEQSLAIRHHWGGEYTISGYVNEKEKGCIRIVTIDRDTGKEIGVTESQVTEYVGWSTAPDVFFPFRVTVWTGDASPERGLRFRIIFAPADPESRERVVMTKDVEKEGEGVRK